MIVHLVPVSGRIGRAGKVDVLTVFPERKRGPEQMAAILGADRRATMGLCRPTGCEGALARSAGAHADAPLTATVYAVRTALTPPLRKCSRSTCGASSSDASDVVTVSG